MGSYAWTRHDPRPPCLRCEIRVHVRDDGWCDYCHQEVPEEIEMAKQNYEDVFTENVVARWYKWLQEGQSADWIAENNGVARVSGYTVRKYLKKFGYPSTIAEAQAQADAERGGTLDRHDDGDAESVPAPASNGAYEVALSMPEPDRVAVNGSLPAVINQLQALRKVLGAAGADVRVKASVDLHISMKMGHS